jgi:non-specific serine/threonine protein kinase
MCLRLANLGHPDLGDVEESGSQHYHHHLMRPGSGAVGIQAWLKRIETDQDNMRAALAWLLDAEESELALHLATALGTYWRLNGDLSEGISWLQRVLNHQSTGTEHLRASAHLGLGQLAMFRGDYILAIAQFNESQSLWERLHDDFGVLEVRAMFANIAEYQGDDKRSSQIQNEVLQRARGRFNELVAVTLANLGYMAYWQRDFQRAASLAQEAVDLKPQRPLVRSLVFCSAAQINIAHGHIDRAASLYAESLSTSESVPIWIASALSGFAEVASVAGRPKQAARLLGAVAASMEQHQLSVLPFHVQHERALARTRAELSPEAFEREWVTGRALSLDDAIIETHEILAAVTETTVAPASSATTDQYDLTKRELEVLRLLVEGKSDREIAAALFISPHTVMRHVAGILGKLDVASRTAAATWAVRNGLV